jgi:glycosyltransferase involved in cell wall biosynthesis
MPTLLTINNYHYRRGGADVAYLEQTGLFERHGWKVASFAMKHPDNVPSPWERYFVQEIEYGHQYGAARSLVNAAKSIYSWEAAAKLAQLIAEVRPDVAHAHNIYHHLSPSVLRSAKQAGIPVFLTLHDLKLLCPARTMLSHGAVCEACKPHKLHNVIVKKCMKSSLALSSLIFLESSAHQLLGLYENHVDRFISPSRFLMNKFFEWGWNPDRIVYVPNYVDAASFEPCYQPGRSFLYFGRLSEEKGLSTLIKAAAKAKVALRLVGAGPQQESLRALADSLHADVTFSGFKSGDELWNLIRDSRAVVIPSELYENAPISVLEAYALGKPVIGARIGGIPEMIRDEQTGALFESKDVEGLASVLGKFSAMPDARIERFGIEARRLVLDEYSPERHYESLKSLYFAHGVA